MRTFEVVDGRRGSKVLLVLGLDEPCDVLSQRLSLLLNGILGKPRFVLSGQETLLAGPAVRCPQRQRVIRSFKIHWRRLQRHS